MPFKLSPTAINLIEECPLPNNSNKQPINQLTQQKPTALANKYKI